MGKHEKLIETILHGKSDANIAFDDIRKLLIYLGFSERIRGNHHIYRKTGIEERITLQREGNKAKPYQVRQVLGIMLKYHLNGEGE